MVIGVDDALILGAMAAASAGAGYLGTKETNSANAALNRGAMKFQFDVDQWNMANQWEMFNQTRDFNAWQAQMGRDFGAQQASLARSWQEQLSNTAYQRSRRDMLAAGLNPILAASQGGAAVPSGAVGSASNASVGTPSPSSHGAPAQIRMENALGPAVANAMQAANLVMGVQQTAASIDETKARTALASASEANQRSQAALNSASAVTEVQRAGLVKSQRATEAVMPSLRSAQSAAASAAAVESGERAISEVPRRDQMREEAYRARMGGDQSREGAFMTREQRAQLERYGTGSIRGVSPSAVIQPFRSAGEWIRSFLR